MDNPIVRTTRLGTFTGRQWKILFYAREGMIDLEKLGADSDVDLLVGRGLIGTDKKQVSRDGGDAVDLLEASRDEVARRG